MDWAGGASRKLMKIAAFSGDFRLWGLTPGCFPVAEPDRLPAGVRAVGPVVRQRADRPVRAQRLAGPRLRHVRASVESAGI